MAKPQLDTMPAATTDREVITNVKRLADHVGSLDAKVDTLQQQVNNLPAPLTLEQIKMALLAEGLLVDPVRP